LDIFLSLAVKPSANVLLAASLACAKRLVRCDAVVAAADSPSITAGESRLQEIVRVLQQKEGKCRAEIILLDIM
jgi:hypothetical protein